MTGERARLTVAAGGLLVCLCLVTYSRAMLYPFIADDYIQIRLARLWGTPDNWRELAAEPLYRCRATSLYLTAATERLFGLEPVAYNASSVLLHAANAGLVMLLGITLGLGTAASFAAGAFFAVYEGHQEAVIWYSAAPEQLMLLLALGSLLCWARWLRKPLWRWYAASLTCFLLALFSKEPAVMVVPLMLLLAWWRGVPEWRRVAAGAAPLALLGGAYVLLVMLDRERHQFFFDGTFALTPGFLHVLPRSLGRMLFFWGALAILVLGRSRVPGLALGWMAAALLPYSFLTYMPRVPSRHTYFAAVGLALLVGSAFQALRQRWATRPSWLAPALAGVIVLHNWVYLWTRKHQQFLERAAPTEQLLAHLQTHREHRGPVWVLNFPYDQHIAYSAVAVATDRDPDSVVVAGSAPAGSHALLWNGRDFVVDGGVAAGGP
jgi:hypothetical protein